MFDFWTNFFRLTRPLSNVKNIAIIAVAFYFSNAEFHLLPIILGFFSMSFISSAIYGYNAINDLNLDKNNVNKKYYAQGVRFFGKRKSFVIVSSLIIAGLILGMFFGYYFLLVLILLLASGFLYSSKYTRFKEKIGLDVLFGASLTFLFRFIAAWFIFSNSCPFLLPMLALVFGKTAGYLLYKGIDREYLLAQNIKNTITSISLGSLLLFSFSFVAMTIFSIGLMFLNSVYFNIGILGSLPVKAITLIPLVVPPLVIIFLQIKRKTKFSNPFLRFCGYIYMLLVTIIIYWVLL
jgi:4-hydroxybenzoate polyprenyltransferase